MAESLEERVGRFSPAELDIFKKQLPLRLKDLGDVERNTALERLSGIPQLSDLFQPQAQPTVPQQPIQQPEQQIQPWWERALEVFGAPFEFVERNVIQPIGGLFIPDEPGRRQPGEDFWAFQRRQWEEWNDPEWNTPWGMTIGLKETLEVLPWFAVPGAAGIGGGLVRAGRGLAQAGKVARLAAPVVKGAGQAIRYSPWGLVERGTGALIGRGIRALGRGAGRVSTAAGERVAGKIIPKELPPAVAKLQGYLDDVILPIEEVFKKVGKPALRTRQTKAAVAIARRIERGEIDPVAGLRAQKAALRGSEKELFAVPDIAKAIFDEDDIFQLLNAVDDAAFPPLRKIGMKDALYDLLRKGKLAEPREYELLGDVFGREFKKTILKFSKLNQTTLDKVLDIAGLPRAVLSSYDLSATFRQGAQILASRPWLLPKMMKIQIKSLMTEKWALQADDVIKAMSNGPTSTKLGIQHGLDILDFGGRALSKLEESFPSRLARNIPGIHRSERAFVNGLNYLRAAQWNSISGPAVAAGASAKSLQGIARLVNVMSGRGELGALSNFGPFLNTLMFSPKLQMAKFQLPAMLLSKNPYVRKEAARGLVNFIGAGAAVLTGLKMAGIGDVELDPRSSDFGKLKIKGTDTRLDVWTGYSQWLRFFAQVTGAEKKTASGNIEPLSRDEVVFRMMQSKASPAAGLLVDILRGEDFMGRKLFTDTTGALDQVGNRLLPLFVQDLYDAIEQEGLLGAVVASPGFLGVGIVTYLNEFARIKDEIANETVPGAEWEDLDPVTQRELLSTNDRLKRAQKERDKRTQGNMWSDYRDVGTLIRDQFEENIVLASAQFRDTRDGVRFRERISEAYDARRANYTIRESDPRFQVIVERIEDNPEDLSQEEGWIKAYSDMLHGDDMLDGFGEYRYDEAAARKLQFVQSFGQEALDYVDKFFAISYETLPVEFQAFVKAKEDLKPYWSIADEVWGNLPRDARRISDQARVLKRTDVRAEKKLLFESEFGPRILWARKWIALMQKRWKFQNPDAARMLRIFYSF